MGKETPAINHQKLGQGSRENAALAGTCHNESQIVELFADSKFLYCVLDGGEQCRGWILGISRDCFAQASLSKLIPIRIIRFRDPIRINDQDIVGE